MKNKLQFKVPASLEGERLDKALRSLSEQDVKDGKGGKGSLSLSRAQIKKWAASSGVLLNGRPASKAQIVHEGDELEIIAEHDLGGVHPLLPDRSQKLDVAFMNEHLMVVDKPAGMPCIPLRHAEVGTLANVLIAYYPELMGLGYSERDSGLLHRLDTETSGAALVARHEKAFAALKNAMDEGKITKTYLLLCESKNLADEATIDFPLANHPKDKRRVYACVHPRDVARYKPRHAHTSYVVVEKKKTQLLISRGDEINEEELDFALVRVSTPKALRHQIRVHFASISSPLFGDELYGGKRVKGLGRHALHAEGIRCDLGPGSELNFDVSLPLPDDMAQFI